MFGNLIVFDIDITKVYMQILLKFPLKCFFVLTKTFRSVIFYKRYDFKPTYKIQKHVSVTYIFYYFRIFNTKVNNVNCDFFAFKPSVLVLIRMNNFTFN